VSDTADDALVAVLTDAQQLGFLGARPIAEVIEHARGFVRALDVAPAARTVLDLGSGGGVPGLVIAHDRPDLRVVLLDRRSKRTDFLHRAVRRLHWDDRVTVITADAQDVAADVGDDDRDEDRFDAVVARGFGPPADTLRLAARLVHHGGPIVISEPPPDEPSADRWNETLLLQFGLERLSTPAPRSPLEGRVVVFVRA
jgi:16S rRNA (guanine527-N7)-methyltransferase